MESKTILAGDVKPGMNVLIGGQPMPDVNSVVKDGFMVKIRMGLYTYTVHSMTEISIVNNEKADS